MYEAEKTFTDGSVGVGGGTNHTDTTTPLLH